MTGEACVLFNSDADCQAAHAKLDQKYIGTRWVKLIRVVVEEYNNFDTDSQNRYSGNDYGARRGGGNFSRGGGDFDSFRGGRGGRGRGRGRGRGGFNNNGSNEFTDRGGYGGGQGRGGFSGGNTVRLSDFVNADNQYTTLKMRGLPFSVSEREIRDFF